MLGITGGLAGAFIAASHELAGAVVVLAAFALTVSAYVMAVNKRQNAFDGTTEAAAIVVVAIGVAAGLGWTSLAAGAGSIVVLALREKARLHALVARVGEVELRGALQFAALALVVLPLLPRGPLFGALAIEPRALWTVVLIFLGINYVGYLIRHALGPDLGYGVAGAVGGLVSSTVVTLTFSQRSKRESNTGVALARGIMAASAVSPIRLLVLALVMDAAVGLALAPMLGAVAAAGGVAAWVIGRRARKVGDSESLAPANPLGLLSAIEIAAAFQVAMIALRFTREWWGTSGAFASAALLGLADMDALTFSTIRSGVVADPNVAAAVITTGLVVNMLLKASIVAVAGTAEVRRIAGLGLVGLGAVAGLTLLIAM
jgi:uncharacterized membrane protein (DUF4010 family)